MAKTDQLDVKHIKALEKDLEAMHKAAEAYLHAALELAKHHGPEKVKSIKPHILKAAKHMDRLHGHRKHIKKITKRK